MTEPSGLFPGGAAAAGREVGMMARISSLIVGMAAGAAICVLPSVSSLAADDTNVFAGKTITIIAGLPPGGGVDGEMRVAARHIGRFIPGNPAIVAQNMPGAGGMVLGNFLLHAAPDGLTLAMPGRSGFLLSNVVPQKGVAYDLTKFSYVGGAGSTNNALWLRKGAGIASLADLDKAEKEIVIGALSPRTGDAIIPKVLAKYQGWKFKIVFGYPGFNEVLTATERGEVDGFLTHEGSIRTSRPDLIDSGFLKPVLQSVDDLPGVPLIASVLRDPKEKALLGLLETPSEIGLPLMGPPAMPADRLAILRQAYARMVSDAAYREEAEKRGLPVGRAISGPDLQTKIAASLHSVDPAVLQEYLALTGEKGG
jgi:tripartite-type tricarboxylate transporter receptor subunit TctC